MLGTTSSTHFSKINRRTKTALGVFDLGIVLWSLNIRINSAIRPIFTRLPTPRYTSSSLGALSSFGRQCHPFKMRIRATLISFALAVSAPALAHPDLPAPTVTPAPLIARDDLDKASECREMASTILTPPTPTGSLASWFLTAMPYDSLSSVQNAITTAGKVDVDQACSLWLTTPTPPASLASAMSSYNSRYSSWAASVAPVASSVAAHCTGDGLVGLFGVYGELIAATDAAQCTSVFEHYNEVASSIDSSAACVATPRYVGVVAGVALAAAIVLF
jgi:hypothetical protein